MMNAEIWSFIHDHLKTGDPVILMVVIDSRGSSPGRKGFKMAVTGDGNICGSVGGGATEHLMVEMAKEMLSENVSETITRHQVHDSEAETDKSGMICSGEQTNALIPLSASHMESVTMIKEYIETGRSGILRITNNSFAFLPGTSDNEAPDLTQDNSHQWEYIEKTDIADTIYIIGAGHISLPLSKIMRMLDFRVIVYDNRLNLSTFIANAYAHQKEVIDYNDIGMLIPDGEHNYVAIMSFAHRSDQMILRQLLGKKLKYLGMIGSKAKVKDIFLSLKEEGFSEECFEGIDSPIGISIKSQTPAEIAVSIAAKIILTRNSL